MRCSTISPVACDPKPNFVVFKDGVIFPPEAAV